MLCNTRPCLPLELFISHPHLVSNVVESAEHVRGGAEELHAAALLVLELGRDGGPVRYQPDGEIMFLI